MCSHGHLVYFYFSLKNLLKHFVKGMFSGDNLLQACLVSERLYLSIKKELKGNVVEYSFLGWQGFLILSVVLTHRHTLSLLLVGNVF